MRPLPLRAAALLLLAAACAPNKEAPVDVVVLYYDTATRRYTPVVQTLTTPTDIVSMKGPVAEIIGGARFAINEDDQALLQATTEEEVLDAILKDAGKEVRVSYIENEGALVPADFHSLNIATTYYNFERSYKFFNAIGGLTTEKFGTPPVYYFASFEQNHQVEKDNALFMPLALGFMILPFDVLQKVPMAINLGIVAHEYSHAVFNYRVHGNARYAQVPAMWSSVFGATPGANLLDAINEGSSDFFGTGVTCKPDFTDCDPEFMMHTVPPEFSPETRKIDALHCMDNLLNTMLKTQPYGAFKSGCISGCAYRIGTVFASALWRAAHDRQAVATMGAEEALKQTFVALWNAQDTCGKLVLQYGPLEQSEFDLPAISQAVIDGASHPTLKAALCAAFLDRFGLPASSLSCPGGAESYYECASR